MKSKEFEALSKESQQQYFRLYIEFLKLKNKKVRWRPLRKVTI